VSPTSHTSPSSPPSSALQGRGPGEPGRLARGLSFAGRLAYAIVRKFRDSALHVESTSLAYRTLLSLVPLLAVMFSVLKGFGVQNQLGPFLERSFEPLGEQGPEIAQNVLGFVDNLNFAVLGYTGLVLLFWTVVSLLSRVEEAFDAIWEVPAGRSLLQRFSTYLSVTLVGPVLLASAFGTMTEAMQDALVQRPIGVELFGPVIAWVAGLLPHLLVWLAFAFLYAFMTNARVRAVPALAGALFASVAWFAVGRLFAEFVAGSAQYSAIYSGFAAAVLFVIWLNVGWLITLVGAQVACYWQWPERLDRAIGEAGRSESNAPTLALEAMLLLAGPRGDAAAGPHLRVGWQPLDCGVPGARAARGLRCPPGRAAGGARPGGTGRRDGGPAGCLRPGARAGGDRSRGDRGGGRPGCGRVVAGARSCARGADRRRRRRRAGGADAAGPADDGGRCDGLSRAARGSAG